MESLLEFAKQFPGVYVRGQSIRIEFRYQGVPCKETLKNIKPTKTNLKWAANKRTTILHEISLGTFDYRSHFPDSNRADMFSPIKLAPTVDEALDDWLALKQIEVRKKTYGNYKRDADNHIRPKFGKKRLDQVTQSEIKKWRAQDLGHLENKSINDICIPLRGIFANAMGDRIIDHNPFDHIQNLERDSGDNADPFELAEIIKLTNAETSRRSERNAFVFACWSGVRISEWMALAWEDVDFTKREVRINRSVVRGEYAFPKTKGSHRTVHLIDQAWEALLAQKEITFMTQPKSVSVVGKDNRKVKDQKLTFIFPDSFTGEPYINSARVNERFFTAFLKQNKIRHRGINQARHTFASQLLTKGVAERWIAREMGHTSIIMLEKHYARWMDSEMPEMAQNVSKLFDLTPPQPQTRIKSI